MRLTDAVRTAGIAAGLCLVAPLTVAAPAAHAQGTVKLGLVPENAMPAAGGFVPVRLELSSRRPGEAYFLPSGLTAPLYGTIVIGPRERPRTIVAIVDEPAGKPSRLYVDANGNGDLGDDPQPEWKPYPYKAQDGNDYVRWVGKARLPLGPDGKQQGQIVLYRYDKADPQHADLSSALFYYRDYARAGTVKLAGKTYSAMLDDWNVRGDFRGPDGIRLLIDVNGDGAFSPSGETYPVDKPFNIAGRTYEVAGLTAAGDSFRIEKSAQTVPEILPPPVLRPGWPVVAFTATTTDGASIAFPSAYKGKLVLLDFWATWCDPSRAELPGLTKVFGDFHDKGFEVLGISLDQRDFAGRLTEFTKDNRMPWPQVYDGNYWDAAIAKLYGVIAIPSPVLVDGDTGRIVAVGDALRGSHLADTVAEALARKTKAVARASK